MIDLSDCAHIVTVTVPENHVDNHYSSDSIHPKSMAMQLMLAWETLGLFAGKSAWLKSGGILPLQVLTQLAQLHAKEQTAPLPDSLRSSKKVLRIVCFHTCDDDARAPGRSEGQTANVYACFDLSLKGTDHLMRYLCGREHFLGTPILRFTGSLTERAECLKIVITEIWADSEGQLDAWKQLYVLTCVKKWFGHFWLTEDGLERLEVYEL